MGQAVAMSDSNPTVTLDLWRPHAIVLFDWLKRTDFDAVPLEHPAEKHGLADLLPQLEMSNVVSVTQEEIDAARLEVAND
jgi:hypothetical protein